LLIGNHDKDWIKKVDMSQHFERVERMIEFSDGAQKITLCHYPRSTLDKLEGNKKHHIKFLK